MPPTVCYYYRYPIGYSIERVFDPIRQHVPWQQQQFTCPRYRATGALWNLISARGIDADVHHITGHAHYLAWATPSERTVLTMHDIPKHLDGLRKLIYDHLFMKGPSRQATVVTAVSEFTRQILAQQLGIDSVVVPNPVASEFTFEPKPWPEIPTILQMGTAPRKGLVRVAEALSGIRCHLRVVGPLSPEQAAKLGDVDYSAVEGLTGDQIVDEYRNADIVVFVSDYEGFGLPILEAQATGRPVVTSNCAAMPETAGGAALLVDPHDTESIRNALLDLLGNAHLRNEMVEAGLGNVSAYRPAVIAEQYLAVYRQLV